MPNVERQVTVLNLLGIHVRPAAKLAATALRFRSDVWLKKDKEEINAKSSMEILTLAATQGTTLTVRASGEDAQAAVDAIVQLIGAQFEILY